MLSYLYPDAQGPKDFVSDALALEIVAKWRCRIHVGMVVQTCTLGRPQQGRVQEIRPDDSYIVDGWWYMLRELYPSRADFADGYYNHPMVRDVIETAEAREMAAFTKELIEFVRPQVVLEVKHGVPPHST